MKIDLVDRLKDRAQLAAESRLQRLRRLPWKLVSPHILAQLSKLRRVEAETFFGRRMMVVLPEPVSVRIWRYGVFEHDVTFYVISILEPGDTFVDVGGHFGFFTMLGRELVGETGTVITFEPMPRTQEILKENIKCFSAPARQQFVPAAAGSAPGKLTFQDFGLVGSAFATSETSRDLRFRKTGEVDVAVRTLDSVAEEFGLTSCKLIKIDAENAEIDVVRGAMATIRRLRPSIVIEAGDMDQSTRSTRSVIDILVAEGYRPFEFRDWTIHPHTVTQEAYGYQNILLVPAERVGELVSASH